MEPEKHQQALVIPLETFLQRIAWLDYHGRHVEADALRDLANLCMPPYRFYERAVQDRIASLRRQASQPQRWQ